MTDPLVEVRPGCWEYQGVHAPMAVIEFLRHEGVLCYRVTKWRADGEVGALIGYYSSFAAASASLSSSVNAYHRRERGESGPASAGQAPVIAPNVW